MNVEVLVKKPSGFRPIWLHFSREEDFNDLMSVLRYAAVPDCHVAETTCHPYVKTWASKLLIKINTTLSKTEGVI